MDIIKTLEHSIQLNYKNLETNKINKNFIKNHYSRVISLISPLITENNILKLNEYKYTLLIHLFNTASKIEYIPSIFIKEIAKMSTFKKIELIGLFGETTKKIDLLSLYFKIVTKILNSIYIKEEKKILFQQMISQSINEQTIEKLINLYLYPKDKIDENTSVMLKAITKADFDFFESFGEPFNKIIIGLINSPQRNKYLVNTYFFKIIEKCLIKLKNVESDFLHNLSKLCHSLLDDFFKNKNIKSSKIFQECIRLMYIIYTKRNENNSKIIKFFNSIYKPMLSMQIADNFKEEVLYDLIDVNIYILKKYDESNEYYEYLYNMILDNDINQNELIVNQILNCIEKLFKYETENHFEQIYGVSFIGKLLNNFNIEQTNKAYIINLICKILKCGGQITLKFLKEISFSNFSFFNSPENVDLLKNLLDSILPNVHNHDIFTYYINYLNLLFIHCLNEHYDIKNFFVFIENIDQQFVDEMFFAIVKYATDYFIMLQNKGNYIELIKSQKDDIVNVIIIKFLNILNSYLIKIDIIKEDKYQEILNLYVNFIIVRLFTNSHGNNFDYLLKKSNENIKNEDNTYDIALFNFAYLIPNLIFNRNTSLTYPVKCELSPLLTDNIIEHSNIKILPEGFSSFGDYSTYGFTMRLYYDCIYIQFVSKSYFFIQVFESHNTFKPIPGKEQKLSILSLFDYFSDNTFRLYNKNFEFLSKIFKHFFNTYHFDILVKSNNTLIKNKILSYDLKLLLNFSCFHDNNVSKLALSLFSKYSDYFPFLLNDYDIFEYCINILGIVLSNSVKDFSFFITDIHINDEFWLNLSSVKGKLKKIYSELYEKIEKFFQNSHMINSDNITYNFANYMNKYTNNIKGITEESTFSINILQKLYNNIKKIDIPPTLKTSAYLSPKKFSKYVNEHVLQNYDKYSTISSLNDITSFTDYTKNAKLNMRNMYIGIVAGKMNAIKNENNITNYYDICYYKYKWEILKSIKAVFQECNDLNTLSKKICPIIMEITALIVYSENTHLKFKFNKNIISDELINIITSLPLMIDTSTILEKAAFCWEWILFNNKKLIPLILRNLCYYFKQNNYKNTMLYNSTKKPKSLIFDMESYIQDSIIKAKTEYNKICDSMNFEINDYDNIDDNISSNSKYITVIDDTIHNKTITEDLNEDYIESQIIILQFLKQCMNEFCKIELEKLSLIFDILTNYVNIDINKSLFKSPNYIHLHFLTLSISLELLEIMQQKRILFDNYQEDIIYFQILLILYGLKYFECEKQRYIINSKLKLNELIQTLINCISLLSAQDKQNKEKLNIKKNKQKHNLKKTSISKVFEFIENIFQKKKSDSAFDELIKANKTFKNLLLFLIEDEINNIHYFNNPSSESKYEIKTSQDDLKKLFESLFSSKDIRCVYLIQRFPYISQKFPNLVSDFCKHIYLNKKQYYDIPFALKLYVEHISNNKLVDLKLQKIMSKLIYWQFPSLNYALKFISLTYNNMFGLHTYCVQMLNHASPEALIFYLPQLIQSLRTNTKGQVSRLILRKCKAITTVAHQFLWGTEVEEIMDPKTTKRYYITACENECKIGEICQILKHKILKNFNPMQRKFWYEEDSVFGGINDVSGYFLHPQGEYSNLSIQGMTKEQKTDFVRNELKKLPDKLLPYIYLPTQPNYHVNKILPQTAVTLQSAKKVPFIVSFEAEEYAGPNEDNLITNTAISQFIEGEIFNYQSKVNECFYNGSNLIKMIQIENNKNNNKIIDNVSTKNVSNLFNNLLTTQEILEENFQMSDQEMDDECNTAIYIPKFDLKGITANENEDNDTNSNIKCMVNQELMLFEMKPKNNEDTSYDISDMINAKNVPQSPNLTNNTDILNMSKKNKLIDNTEELNDCSLEEDSINIYENKRNNNNIQNINDNNNTLTNPINTENNKKNNKKTISCIFKVGDDLRQDALALQVIKIVHEIFKENNLNLYTYFYQAISTISKNDKELGGFIEVVENCDSRDQIGKTYETNMYDYYISIFGQDDSKEFRTARKNLVLSLAAYGIISYILQIKDRHNGNILIDIYGHIIHIDFGFIFDISPGGNMKFERAAFKLTNEMIYIMKGQNSEAYSKFVDLTIRAFLACRDYMDKLLDPVVLMFSSGLDCFRENSIKNFIDRFKLNLSEKEAANFMRNEIQTAADNWRTNLYDWIQKKQNNISY